MAERLRVGMLAPIAWRVLPRHYGPWERVESMLTEGLLARGVDVTLFATADSVTRARLSSVAPQGYAENPTLDAKAYECLHIAKASVQAASGAFDILLDHAVDDPPRQRRRRHAHHTPRAQLLCHPLWSHAWLDLACRSFM